MEKTSNTSKCIITCAYNEYHSIILSYITYRINYNRCDAEDLTQDVFLRLLDYKKMLHEDTVKSFLFTIARNVVTDYLRRYYKKQEITTYIYDHAVNCSNETEQSLYAKELLSLEREKLQSFPTQRKTVYLLSRLHDKTTADIAKELNLSKRTVENHLMKGRKIMRTYIRQCV